MSPFAALDHDEGEGTASGASSLDVELERFIRRTAAANARMRDALELLHERDRLRQQMAAAGLGGAGQHELILAEVAAKHGLSVKEMREGNRDRRYSWPRQEAMRALREVRLTDGRHRYSLPQIARMVGVKNHATVIHGLRVSADRGASAKARAEA